MRRHKLVPQRYEECIWLMPEDLCDILNISRESCMSLLNSLYDQGSKDGYEFMVHRKNQHYKVDAESFWIWFNRNHCWIED